MNSQGYWASYNRRVAHLPAAARTDRPRRPYVRRFFEALGYAQYEELYGSYYFGYHGYFRALIFEREQRNITVRRAPAANARETSRRSSITHRRTCAACSAL